MQVQWLQKFDSTRQDSIWYGGDIVCIHLKRYDVIIGAYGDVRATINGNYYVDKCNGGQFSEYLEDENIYNDNDLKQAIQEGRIEWDDNNWFEAFIWDTKTKDWLGNSWDMVLDELDANDDFAWLESWVKEHI